MNIDSLEFSVSTEPVSEEVALGNFTKDWDYTRPKRNTKASITFRDSDNLKYYVAKITNIVVDGKEKPEWVGKQIGYSGVGEYDDLLVDGGSYTLSGTSKDASDDIPNFREFGIYPALAAKRNTLAKSLATDKPFLITLNLGIEKSTYLDSQADFHKNHTGLPSWALDRLGTKKTWYVYNPIEKVEKWFNVLKVMSPPKSEGHIRSLPPEQQK